MRMLLVILILSVSFLSAGCGDGGPKTYHVSGVVRHEGKAVPTGNVMFVPDEGPAVLAPIGAEGRFELRAVAGRHRVAVRQASAAGMSPEASVDAGKQAAVPVKIPAKYHRYDTSKIAVEVGADADNTFDITLD